MITNAAVGVPNVKALVYIAGFAPDKGESLVQLVGMNPGTLLGPTTLIQRKYPLADGTEGTDLYITENGFETAFASDVRRSSPIRCGPSSGRSRRRRSLRSLASLRGRRSRPGTSSPRRITRFRP